MTLWPHLSWPAWRDQPGRIVLAVVAVMLGVALAFGVHLLNGAALTEFARAARSVSGQPDLVVRGRQGPLRDADLAALWNTPGVAVASPVLEAQALWPEARGADGQPQQLRLVGLDALALLASASHARPLAPQLLPQLDARPGNNAGWRALLAGEQLHLNPAARALLPADGLLRLRIAQPDGRPREVSLHAAGRVAAGRGPLAVLDIADAQALTGRLGQLDRVDLQLQPGSDAATLAARLNSSPHWQAGAPQDEGERLADLTRAYRVNLGLLALMALFTGAFLVYAVLSLATAQRLPQWALVGVLGLSARARWQLILLEGGVIGLAGTALGLALGAGLAAGALKLMGSTLGLQVNAGSSAALLWQQPLLVPALVYGGLGLAAALLAALAPAVTVARIAPAQVLKGLGLPAPRALPAWLGGALLAGGVGLAQLPPLADGTAIAAYLSMLALLLGGLVLVPHLVSALTALLARLPAGPLLMLARERSRDQAGESRRTLAGVLVALSLAVAMTVMIGSFRESLSRWLDDALPADVYLRPALRDAAGLPAPLPPTLLARLQALPQFQRLGPQRTVAITLPGGERSQLIARELNQAHLTLVQRWTGAPDGNALPVWVNEAARDRNGLVPGQVFTQPLDGGRVLRLQVAGIWRDYAHQTGVLWMNLADYQRASGDRAVTELQLWLRPGQDLAQAQAALRAAAEHPDDLELAAAGELRRLSLQIFDRSFAITVWLQGIALAVGLFGVVASQSAQALARKREFGLLRHLGLSRRALLRLLLIESSLAGGVGALAGLALGLGLSAVLVFVVNPQSFHWTMDLYLPTARLAALVGLAFAAAVGASWLAGRQALNQDAIRAVREDS